MGVWIGSVLVYLVLVIFCVQSQNYNPYSQYAPTPYVQYPSDQNNAYSYQPYVSRQYVPPLPYYLYPTQSYYQPNYGSYGYPSQRYPYYGPSYYPSQSYYSPSYPTQSPPDVQPVNSYPTANNQSAVNNNSTLNDTSNITGKLSDDPYADIKTEIIDVEPQVFDYYTRFFKLEPVSVISDSPTVQVHHSGSKPYIRTESRSSNYSNIPTSSIHKHDVQTKTFTFKKTFTLDPNSNGSKVISLHFLNGDEVTTTEQPNNSVEEVTLPIIPRMFVGDQPEEITTTETDEPANVISWIN